MVSLSYFYRIGKSTTSEIISETCAAIWTVLQPDVLKPPPREEWEKIAADFELLWNFPNCVGALDGKHVIVQCFQKTGSAFYNYKGSFSIVLMACCDAQYRFTCVSIGSAGRESDGGIFNSCDFGQAILREHLPLPQAKLFKGFHEKLPAVFVGDAAFPLRVNLMRPYGGADLTAGQTIFNYRLSRARRVVENAFGVLATRFRIFRRPIIASSDTVDKIVQASVVLHNWLRNADTGQQLYMPEGYVDWEDNDGNVHPGQWREETSCPGGLVQPQRTVARNPAQVAKRTRDNFQDYFMTVGQVQWQWQKLPVHGQPFAASDEE